MPQFLYGWSKLEIGHRVGIVAAPGLLRRTVTFSGMRPAAPFGMGGVRIGSPTPRF